MHINHYSEQMRKLINVFGEKNFPEERLKALWEKVKFSEANDFTVTVNKIILERYSPPPASVILEELRNEKKTVEKKSEEINFDCSWCGQSGFVTAKKKQTGTEAAFKCACSWFSYKANGRFLSWSKDLNFDYSAIFYCFDGPGDTPYKIMHKKYEPTESQKDLLEKVQF